MGRTHFHKKDLIFLKEREAVSSASTKLVTLSWPVTRLAWNVSSNQRTQPQQTRCSSLWEAWMNFVPLLHVNPEIDAFYQKHWDEDILLVVSFLGVKMPMQNYKPSEMDVKNSWQTFVELSCLSSNLVKLVRQIAKEMWEKEGKMVYASSANPSGKGNRLGRSKESVSVSKVPWTVIEADDYVASIQPDKTIETLWTRVMVSMVWMRKKIDPRTRSR